MSELNEKTCRNRNGRGWFDKYRHLLHDPHKMFRKYISEGMQVLDIGCGTGSLAVGTADMIGADGKLYLVDIQEAMLSATMEKLKSHGYEDRATPILSKQHSLCMQTYKEQIDFAYSFAVAHEVSDKLQFLSDIRDTMKQEGRFLIAEPRGHVPKENFDETISIAKQLGFAMESGEPHINICRVAVFRKE